MWKIDESRHDLEGARVRVKGWVDSPGTITAVKTDRFGNAWLLHVRLDLQSSDEAPLILDPAECSLIELPKTKKVSQ